MRNDYTDIIIVLDRSGSMCDRVDDTIGGFNEFIEEQKTKPGKLKVTLLQFSNYSDYTYKAADIKSIKPLNKDMYRVGGGTALLDAVGKAISETGKRLSNMSEDKRPSKVMIVIMTDGYENASIFYPREQGGKQKITEMIDHQKGVYSWDFSFIGAGLDEMDAKESYGSWTSTAGSVCVSSNKIRESIKMMSGKLAGYRGLDASVLSPGEYIDAKNSILNYTDQEKAALKS